MAACLSVRTTDSRGLTRISLFSDVAGRKGTNPQYSSMKNLNRQFAIFVLLLGGSTLLRGDAGVLIPSGHTQPDASILSLEEMEITIRIDNGDARVYVREIFANHIGGIQEANYIFALPSRATISDFAVWDGLTRIPV